MADMVTVQELENAKIDARTIGESVNENKIVTPRYGAPFKSMPMIAEEMQGIIGTIIAGGVPANIVLDASGATQQEINNYTVNVKQFGAIGDGTLHKVQEWTIVGSKIYYPNLAAIQVDYPFVSSLDDSIDWAAIQKALNTGRNVIGPQSSYQINESLYYKTSRQKFEDLGVVNIDASLGKPCLHVGASDKNGTPSLVWTGSIYGITFLGSGARAVGSCGINMVFASQVRIGFEARGFDAGLGESGACYANTFNTLTLIQNTRGIASLNSIADLQGSIFNGGRIEQNKEEGIRTRSVNIKFIGTVIEGNGLWDGGDGTKPEVMVLGSTASGAVTFTDCYFESLDGKSAGGIIEIEASATRHVFINGGEYFGGVANKLNIVPVQINAPASASCSVHMTGAMIADVKNYGRGVISGDSQFSVINCQPRESYALWLDVTVGTGNPLIQQLDRAYWYTNQIIRVGGVTSTGLIQTTDLVKSKYTHNTDTAIGSVEFDGYKQSRQYINASAIASPIVVESGAIANDINYLYEIKCIGRVSATVSHSFTANLVVNRAGGIVTIEHQQVMYNSKAGQTLSFTVNGSNQIVCTATSGDSLNLARYRSFYARFMQA